MIQPANVRSVRVHEHEGTYYALCANADGTRLYAGSSDGTVHIYDADAEQPGSLNRWHEKHGNYVSSLAYV